MPRLILTEAELEARRARAKIRFEGKLVRHKTNTAGANGPVIGVVTQMGVYGLDLDCVPRAVGYGRLLVRVDSPGSIFGSEWCWWDNVMGEQLWEVYK